MEMAFKVNTELHVDALSIHLRYVVMKGIFKLLFSRAIVAGIAIITQVVALILVVARFGSYFVYFYAGCLVLSAITVFWILVGRTNPAYKIVWIVPILLFPIFGGIFYLLLRGSRTGSKISRRVNRLPIRMAKLLQQDGGVEEELATLDRGAANQSRYIYRQAYSPVYKNTATQYLTPGERAFDRIKEELLKAERYIFLEFFIIEDGVMWRTILDILKSKVAMGVDVRVIYDDLGCMLTLPYGYDRVLRAEGIKCVPFNPVSPILSSRSNYRDHRKILVIDGRVAFTGGINLADEYINARVKHGHWKDAAIVLDGDAAWSFTVMFLLVWGLLNDTKEDYQKFKPMSVKGKPEEEKRREGKSGGMAPGFVQPYTDSPIDEETVGETVYLNMIGAAREYLYINTPYLILDNEMITALCSAAKRSVDVRIVTPHLGDKWFIHMVTRENYIPLIEAGVKIYEYVPGFIHSKTFVSDDEIATVGTVNLDFRSLYLHFECGVWLYRTGSVMEVKEDFLNTLAVCKPITGEDCLRRPWHRKLLGSLLRIFAPLM